MTIGGTQQFLNVKNNVYDPDPLVLAWVAMTQPLVSTDTLTVAGTMSVTNFQDPLEKYKISGIDTATVPYYFGYEDSDGGWYIMRRNTTTGVTDYVKGGSNYSAAWTGRVAQSYASFASTF
jgi:hypothetical protein